MSIGSSIWYSRVATLQPKHFRLCFPTSSLLCNLFRTQCEINVLGTTPQPSAPISDEGLQKYVRNAPGITIRLLIFSTHAQNPQLDVAVADIRQACSICTLPADEPCNCCNEKFCTRHIYQCAECQISFCGECFDLHNNEGHWSDSDTTGTLSNSSSGRFGGKCSTTASHLPEAERKAAFTFGRDATIVSIICNSTLDKILYLLPFQDLFSLFVAVPTEARR